MKLWGGGVMVIQVEQRNVYGNIKFYPVNDTAERLATLMKQKTFDAQNLRDIAGIGLAIEVQQPAPAWAP
jgi:hypothetical protein